MTREGTPGRKGLIGPDEGIVAKSLGRCGSTGGGPMCPFVLGSY